MQKPSKINFRRKKVCIKKYKPDINTKNIKIDAETHEILILFQNLKSQRIRMFSFSLAELL